MGIKEKPGTPFSLSGRFWCKACLVVPYSRAIYRNISARALQILQLLLLLPSSLTPLATCPVHSRQSLLLSLAVCCPS